MTVVVCIYIFSCKWLYAVSLQEDINVTTEVGRQHILGQTIEEKKRLLKNWILRDHHSSVSLKALCTFSMSHCLIL